MENCLHSIFIVNQEIRSSCDFNPFLFEGEGFVYEVIRVIDGVPVFLQEHLNRLENSARLALFAQLPDTAFISRSLMKLVELNRVDFGNIKLVFRPSKPEQTVHYAAWFQPHSYPTISQYNTGYLVSLFEKARPNPNAKLVHKQYQQDVATAIALDKVDEVLLAVNGHVTEGSKSNVFFIQDNTLITPPENQVLPGITRQKIIEIAQNNGINVLEISVKITDLQSMEAAFITGTSPKIMPVRQISGLAEYPTNNILLRRLMELYDASIAQNIRQFKS